MSHYPTIAAYTADVIAAREAYRADQEVAAGYCETGDGRKRDVHNRRRLCLTCARKRWAGGQP